MNLWAEFINREAGRVTLRESESLAFKIYFSSDAQSVVNNERYRNLSRRFEEIKARERQNEIQLISPATSLNHESDTLSTYLKRAVKRYIEFDNLFNSTGTTALRRERAWADLSDKSIDHVERCQKLWEYLQGCYKLWASELSSTQLRLIKTPSAKEKEEQLISQLNKIATSQVSSDSLKGSFAHEIHFDEWMQQSDDLSACLISVNSLPIQEWLIYRLRFFYEEIRGNKILPLHTNRWGRRGWEQQLLNTIASHFQIPRINYDYAENVVIKAIVDRIQQSPMTFVFYGLDQLSMKQKEMLWTFWFSVINQIQKSQKSHHKIICLMLHSIGQNCLNDQRLYSNSLTPLKSIDSEVMKCWIHDELGNDDAQVRALFDSNDDEYEEEIKPSLLSPYESVQPLIQIINQYATQCTDLSNLREYWSLVP